MADAQKGPRLTPQGRVSFPDVYKATAMQEGQALKFGLTLIFPKDMNEQQAALLAEMKNAAAAAIKEKWGNKIPPNLRNPFRDAGEKTLDGYNEGDTFVRFSTKQRPHVVDQAKRPIEEESRDFYAGCWAHCTYTVYAYDKAGNRGVAFGLLNVQKTRDDEPFAGGSNPDQDFEVLAGDTSDALANFLGN